MTDRSAKIEHDETALTRLNDLITEEGADDWDYMARNDDVRDVILCGDRVEPIAHETTLDNGAKWTNMVPAYWDGGHWEPILITAESGEGFEEYGGWSWNALGIDGDTERRDLIATLLKGLDREELTTLCLSLSLCPMHLVDYAICFDDDNEECAAIRDAHPNHDT